MACVHLAILYLHIFSHYRPSAVLLSPGGCINDELFDLLIQAVHKVAGKVLHSQT